MNKYVQYLMSFLLACLILLIPLTIVLLPIYVDWIGWLIFPIGFVVVLYGLTRLIYRDVFHGGKDDQQ